MFDEGALIRGIRAIRGPFSLWLRPKAALGRSWIFLGLSASPRHRVSPLPLVHIPSPLPSPWSPVAEVGLGATQSEPSLSRFFVFYGDFRGFLSRRRPALNRTSELSLNRAPACAATLRGVFHVSNVGGTQLSALSASDVLPTQTMVPHQLVSDQPADSRPPRNCPQLSASDVLPTQTMVPHQLVSDQPADSRPPRNCPQLSDGIPLLPNGGPNAVGSRASPRFRICEIRDICGYTCPASITLISPLSLRRFFVFYGDFRGFLSRRSPAHGRETSPLSLLGACFLTFVQASQAIPVAHARQLRPLSQSRVRTDRDLCGRSEGNHETRETHERWQGTASKSCSSRAMPSFVSGECWRARPTQPLAPSFFSCVSCVSWLKISCANSQ